jgi:uncharacterized protein
MTEPAAASVQRVTANERIANLDVLRGIAILAILIMNIPFMGGYVSTTPGDPRLVSWTVADQATFRFVGAFLDGTQRGLLELLFGAGIMIMSRAAMRPDGPVAVADLHYRRNLLLVALGVFQALVLFWPGDILFPYGLTAIFVFPFRKLAARWQALIGVLVILVAIVPAVNRYNDRVELKAAAVAVQAKLAAHKPVTKDEQGKLDEWNKKVAAARPLAQNPDKQKAVAEEKKARLGPIAGYATWTRDEWLKFNFAPDAWFGFAEIFGTMLLGMALYQWGLIQGRAAAGVYLAMIAVGYGIGVPLRWMADTAHLRFTADPKPLNMTWDVARIALTLGHVGLINLALKSSLGAKLLSPFQATGKMPLTTYLSASLIGMVILFPGFGLGLFGRYGWAGLETIALVVMAAQLVAANLWLLAFETGPLEWFWKSAAYGKRQPFRRAVAPKGALAAAE